MGVIQIDILMLEKRIAKEEIALQRVTNLGQTTKMYMYLGSISKKRDKLNSLKN